MDGHGKSSAGSYLANPTSPIPSHCVSIVVTSTLRVKNTPIFAKVISTMQWLTDGGSFKPRGWWTGQLV